jgi:hypothetical protein
MNSLREAEKEEIKLSQSVLDKQYDCATNDLKQQKHMRIKSMAPTIAKL